MVRLVDKGHEFGDVAEIGGEGGPTGSGEVDVGLDGGCGWNAGEVDAGEGLDGDAGFAAGGYGIHGLPGDFIEGGKAA